MAKHWTKRESIGLVIAVLLIPIGATAQQSSCVYPSMANVEVNVKMKVTKSLDRFSYLYRVENAIGAQQTVVQFAVQAFLASQSPVEHSSPPGWNAFGTIRDTAYHTWLAEALAHGLPPGTSVAGFALASDGLPAIVEFRAWGNIEPPTVSDMTGVGCGADDFTNTDIIENSFKGRTIGPKTPPPTFVPIEFLNYLISLVHDSRQQGWITRDGAHQSLLVKLTNAKRKLEGGDTNAAANILNAFLNELGATSCQDFSCHGNKPLTSEAFALLFFNGQYLANRLP